MKEGRDNIEQRPSQFTVKQNTEYCDQDVYPNCNLST